MAGLTSKEKKKLRQLRSKAATLDDPIHLMNLSNFAVDMNNKYGEGTVDDPADVYNKGGMSKKKKKVPAISISVGMVEIPKGKGKAQMAKGGMAYGKQHMYSAGGTVKMNPGLKALKKASPEAFNKITKNA